MSAPSKIRVGVIGAGAFAEACHIPGLQSHPQAEVAAVCGRRVESAQALADKFGIGSVHTDFRELCARADIDAVTIATPNVFHAEQCAEAFRCGRHVFCEKPLGMNVAEVEAVTRAAQASGRVHQTAFTFRYNYGIRELRRRIRAGDVGRPFYARVQYDNWEALKADWKTGWREKQEIAGGGLLFDVGSHLFDIARHVLGPIEAAAGFTHHIPRERPDARTGLPTPVETDDFVNAWFRHGSGVRGQFFISRVTPPFAQNGYLEIIGEEGALKAALSRGRIDFLKASRPGAPEWVDLPLPAEARDDTPHALALMMRSFVDACLRGGIDPDLDASFDDGLAAQRAIAAVLEAQAQERWVRLDEILEPAA